MKKILNRISIFFFSLLFVLAIIPATLLAKAEVAKTTKPGYLGVDAGVEVPKSFTNDLWTQFDFKEMEVTDTEIITPRRVEEAITNYVGNDVELPHFNYEIIYGDSIRFVESENAHQKVEAIRTGNTIVQITYDELNHKSDKYFAPTDPINTQYIAFSVGGSKNITLTHTGMEKIRSYDTIYFYDGKTTTLPITAKQEGGVSLTVKVNGIEVTAVEMDKYNLPLENRNNIVEITSEDGVGNFRSFFKVIAARKVKINVANKSNPGQPLFAGDTANISFTGIKMPVYKLATIYNPCFGGWGGTPTNIHFMMNGKKYVGNCSQYDLATNNDFDVQIPSDGTFKFTEGKIFCTWWGSPLGTDKGQHKAGDPNLNAPITKDEFSFFPDFEIQAKAGIPVQNLQLVKDTIVLNVKGEETIAVTFTPTETTQKSLKFESDNPSVASVDATGKVVAKAAGVAKITVTSQSNPDLSVVCTVNVNKGDFNLVVEAINALPETGSIKASEAWELKSKIAQIYADMKNLLEDIEKVTNAKKLDDVNAAVKKLLADNPFEITDGSVNVLKPDVKIKDKLGWTRLEVKEVPLGEGVTEITLNANVPYNVKIMKEYNSGGRYTNASSIVTLLDNKKESLKVNLVETAKARVPADLYNGGKWDGPWSGDQVEVPFGLITYREAKPFINFYLVVELKDGTNRKFGFTFVEKVDVDAAKEVVTKIAEIGDVTLDSQSKIYEVKKAYNALSAASKLRVSNVDVLDIADAKYVDLKINAIGEVTLKNRVNIASAREAYNSLSNKAKTKVTTFDTLITAEAKYVDLRINLIGEVTLDRKSAIYEAKYEYNLLTKEAQAKVTNLNVLTAAEEKYVDLLLDEDAKAVDAEIGKIGEVTLDSKDKIEAARKAYDALDKKAQDKVTTLDVLTTAEAKYVDLKINAIGDVTLDSKNKIEEVRKAYDALTEAAKAKVTAFDVLETAEEKYAYEVLSDEEKAQLVVDEIALIGEVTLEKKSVLDKAQTAYDALPDTAKAKVVNINLLKEAFAKYDALKETDEKATTDAKAVDAKINAIGEVTLASKNAIVDARNAFSALTDAAKVKVTALDKLVAAEVKYIEVKADADAQAKAELDKKASEDASIVDAKINAIGEVTLASKNAIIDARNSFSALSDAAKVKVTALDKLVAAEVKYIEVKEADDALKASIEAVENKIFAIGEVTLAKKAVLDEIKNAYDALSEEARAKVVNVNVLTEAIAKYEILKVADEKATSDAKTVDTLINAIGEVTIDSKTAIEEARNAYAKLSETAKSRVTVLNTLEEAETALANLVKANAEKGCGGNIYSASLIMAMVVMTACVVMLGTRKKEN